MGRETTYTHDDLGRVETITTPDPDGEGGVSASVWEYAYYNNDLTKSVTDPLGHTTDYFYNIRASARHG